MTLTDKGKIYTLLYVPITYIYLVNVGAAALAILSNRVSQINVQTRFMVDDDAWPPKQPTNFTPLLLIHHHGDRTPEQVRAMAELTCKGDIGKVALVTDQLSGITHDKLDSHKKFEKAFETSRTTKEIEEILAPLEQSKKSCFVLIEGAPGIGKSVLLKEIAYRWGNKGLLQKADLVLLLSLRDPSLHQIKSVSNLLQLFYKGDEDATEIIRACSGHLSKNGGKSLTLLLDGYDEYPSNLQKSSLIADIIKRQVLPLCGLVISSRPHASQHLRNQATIRVDILGFTETEREHYIKQALPDQPHKIEELTQYLHQQPSIDSICFIPFNMVILLYLFKLEISLPKNSTELYHHFISSTISHHLSKLGNPLTYNITDLTDLPEPYNRIIQQLSKLSLEALNSNKLIFTLDDITAACPDIAAIPGAINGFGLLQAVQHFGLHTKTMTLHFLHFTIQEFLAAHYISHLPTHEELKVIEASFWNDVYFNTFSIYISLTKGQRPSFKHFFSDGNKAIAISPKFLKDQLKCLRLYCIFNEADDHAMCYTIEQAEIFHNKIIILSLTTLLSNDMECLSLFLTSSSNKQWEELNLYNCHIQDKGLNILCRILRHSSDVIINQLVLMDNGLTAQSSSLISELSVNCRVRILRIDGNHTIGEDQQLYYILTDPFTTLEVLYMWHTELSSQGAIHLFNAVKDNNTLKKLKIDGNSITDDACDVITTALEKNSCLVTLSMNHNPLSSEAIINIVRCLEVNKTLQLLGLPDCPQGVQENVTSLQEAVNKMRKSQGCQVKLKIKLRVV